MAVVSTNVQTVTIAQSAKISGNIDLTNARAIGIVSPVVTSCQLFLQVALNTTSASFVRVHTMPHSHGGELKWDVGAGSKALAVGDHTWPFTNARLETSVFQAAARNFQVVVRRD